RPTTPPEARSASHESRWAALFGMKKSTARSPPSVCTCRRTTDSASTSGGLFPGVELLGAPPLPVVKKMRPGPSDIRPVPDIQIPDPEGAPPPRAGEEGQRVRSPPPVV